MSFSTNDNLDWNVITRNLFVKVDGTDIKVPGKVCNLRDDNNKVVGVVGNSYNVFQNSSLKEFVSPLVEEGILTIENIGYLGDGQKVFIQASMSDSFRVAGEEHKGLLTLMNSHDGTSALAAGVTDVRVVCSNTFQLGMAEMSTRLRHGMRLQDEAARITEITDYIQRGMDRFSEASEKLATTPCNPLQLEHIVEQTYGKPAESVRAMNNIRSLFISGRGNEGKTLWDAFNGVTEFLTHHSQKDNSKRFASNLNGSNSRLARKAFNAALALV